MAKAELLNDVDRLLAQTCAKPRIPVGCQDNSVVLIDERKLLQCAMEEEYQGADVSKMSLSKMAAMAKSVANQAADGVPWAVEFLFNRLYGKPKQTIATASLTMTLKDYLAHLANGESPETPITDAEVIANGDR